MPVVIGILLLTIAFAPAGQPANRSAAPLPCERYTLEICKLCGENSNACSQAKVKYKENESQETEKGCQSALNLMNMLETSIQKDMFCTSNN